MSLSLRPRDSAAWDLQPHSFIHSFCIHPRGVKYPEVPEAVASTHLLHKCGLPPALDIRPCGREPSGRGASPRAPSPRAANHPHAQCSALPESREATAPRGAIPGLLAALGRGPRRLSQEGAGTGTGVPPEVVPLVCEPAVAVSRHGRHDDRRPEDRAPFRGGPSCALTCAHAGSSRSSPAPALRPVARARASRCPAAGARGGRLGRGTGGWGQKAGGARWPGAPAQEPAAGAAGKVPQSGCARSQAPPSPLRPHVRPARGLPGLVVPAASAAHRSRQTDLEQGWEGYCDRDCQGLRRPVLRHVNTQTHTQRQDSVSGKQDSSGTTTHRYTTTSDTYIQSHTQRQHTHTQQWCDAQKHRYNNPYQRTAHTESAPAAGCSG